MMVPKVLFLVVLFQCVVGEESTDSPASSASQAPLIFRGEIAKEGQFPFMASLVKNGLTDCGGSIIGPNLVLSAAHCVVEYCFHPRIEFNFEKKSAHCYIRKSTAIKILVGSIQWLYGIQYDMKKAIIHSEYDTEDYRNDIALIQIVGTFEYSQTVKPVQFGDVKDDTTCTVIGWGRIESTSIPRYLRYVKIRTLNPVKCLEIFGTFNNYYFGEKHLCTVPDVGKGFCYGDSGGPLFCNGKVVGIVSYRFADCGSGAPEIYIKVHAYSDWIQINSGYVT